MITVIIKSLCMWVIWLTTVVAIIHYEELSWQGRIIDLIFIACCIIIYNCAERNEKSKLQ